jgi:1-deoxy-D-xylulose-5-phosphate reductoisomerase
LNSISILGSTGSIGVQSLDVVSHLGITVTALSTNKNIKLLEEQIRKYKPQIAAVMDEKMASILKSNVADTGAKIVCGIEGICECATNKDAEMVLNSVVGIVGLRPTLEAIKECKTIALANKETLVAGGKLVMELAKEKGVQIIPVDSEHSAIFQCLQGSLAVKKELKKIILTASGGPFFGKKSEELVNISPKDALKHPNWCMGAKISIDSATLMNKGLEFIEAVWLFDVKPSQIDVLVHRQSVIHSLVEFVDNSILAQLGAPDMRLPIQYAITYPHRLPASSNELNLLEYGSLTFGKPDYETFDCLSACIDAIKLDGLKPAAINGANEEAVHLFLNGKIGFLDIQKLVRAAMDNQKQSEINSLRDILKADINAREFVRNSINLI